MVKINRWKLFTDAKKTDKCEISMKKSYKKRKDENKMWRIQILTSEQTKKWGNLSFNK